VRFEVTYTATLNDKAVVNGSNDNKVKLVFYNDPNNSGSGKNTDKPTTPDPENPPTPDPNIPTGETPEKETKTYTTGIYLTKVDGDTSARLTGAEFMLTGTNVIKLYVATETVFTPLDKDATTNEDVYYELTTGAYTKNKPTGENNDAYKSTEQRYTRETVTEVLKVADAADGSTTTTRQVVGTVDGSSGVLVFTGLGAGTYTLTETKAPTGYNKMDPVDFTITYEGNGVFSSTGKGKFDSSDGLIHYVAQNYPGSALPHTGGIGTTIFYVVGSVLVLGACIALITRRRMSKSTK
jgi:LPXTG-motif cell wall-anchored protein